MPSQPAATPAKASGSRPRRAQLSAPLILDAAALVVERDGPAALTLRKLGTELGVNHTAVLRHFSGKDQIVLGLAERVLEEALEGFEPQGEWDDAFAQLARRVRAAYLVHPGIASLVAARVSRSQAEFRGAELVLATFERAGFSGRDAAVLYRTVTDLTLALSAYEASVLVMDPLRARVTNSRCSGSICSPPRRNSPTLRRPRPSSRASRTMRSSSRRSAW